MKGVKKKKPKCLCGETASSSSRKENASGRRQENYARTGIGGSWLGDLGRLETKGSIKLLEGFKRMRHLS